MDLGFRRDTFPPTLARLFPAAISSVHFGTPLEPFVCRNVVRLEGGAKDSRSWACLMGALIPQSISLLGVLLAFCFLAVQGALGCPSSTWQHLKSCWRRIHVQIDNTCITEPVLWACNTSHKTGTEKQVQSMDELQSEFKISLDNVVRLPSPHIKIHKKKGAGDSAC